MKKILLTLLLFIGIANAGWITSMQSATDSKIFTQKRQLETYGLNPRAYVFNIDGAEGAKIPMTCIIVYTEQDIGEKNAKSTAPVMQCVKN